MAEKGSGSSIQSNLGFKPNMGERSGEKCLGVERSKQTNLTKFFEFEFCKAQHGGFQILEKLAIKKLLVIEICRLIIKYFIAPHTLSMVKTGIYAMVIVIYVMIVDRT